MKFYCCGLIYSTENPETYWCIQKYILKKPSVDIWKGKRVEKEIVYTLCCKKNGCLKIEIHKYTNESGILKLFDKQPLKGAAAVTFLERTKNMRVRQPQCCPLRKVQNSKKIPWVYGKAVNSDTQVVRYMDESGNRQVFKGAMLQSEFIKTQIITKNLQEK